MRPILMPAKQVRSEPGGLEETCRDMSARIAAFDSRWNYRNDTTACGYWSQLNTQYGP